MLFSEYKEHSKLRKKKLKKFKKFCRDIMKLDGIECPTIMVYGFAGFLFEFYGTTYNEVLKILESRLFKMLQNYGTVILDNNSDSRNIMFVMTTTIDPVAQKRKMDYLLDAVYDLHSHDLEGFELLIKLL